MKLPNLLETRIGRLTAFFFLYLSEGIPYGFTSIAVATEMRRQGLEPDVIGVFTGSLYLPWAWKWLIGPFVDVLYSDRLGRRRLWIVVAQLMMVATLMAGMGIDFTTQLKLFILVIFIHNIFAATQDVAIDALGCGVLDENERGLANGLMFGGTFLGSVIGGAGVLYLTRYMDFNATFLYVGGAVLTITALVSMQLRESPTERSPLPAGTSRFAAVFDGIWNYVVEAVRAIFCSRPAFIGMVFALLPAGSYALGMALQSVLAVDLGLTNSDIAEMAFFSGLLSAYGCIVGGLLSDRFGRKRMLALYLVATVVPAVCLAVIMYQHCWIMPIDKEMRNSTICSPTLVFAFWMAIMVFSIFQGLMYGTRSALFMDITTPAVAATQFTAYMAMQNLVLAYTAFWQGWAIENWGYPITLLIDAAAGLLCIALLPFMTRPSSSKNSSLE